MRDSVRPFLILNTAQTWSFQALRPKCINGSHYQPRVPVDFGQSSSDLVGKLIDGEGEKVCHSQGFKVAQVGERGGQVVEKRIVVLQRWIQRVVLSAMNDHQSLVQSER